MTQASMRVVGRRPVEAGDLETYGPDDFGVDDDGVVTVPDTVDDADADSAQLIATKRAAVFATKRAAVFATKLAALTPSGYLIYLGLTEAIDRSAAAVNARLGSRSPNLLAAIRLPSPMWQLEAAEAWAVVCAGIASKRLAVDPESRSVTFQEMDRQATEFEIGPLLRLAARKHAAAVYNAAGSMPPAVLHHCDLRVDMHNPDPRLVGMAIARAFEVPAEDVTWPADRIDLREIDAREFDAIVARAADSASLVSTLFEMEVERVRGAMARQQESAADKKAGAASVRSQYVPEVLTPTAPTLDELHGYGPAREWGLRLAEDVADYRKGDLPWSDVDGGCLLSGPPGTGKTMFVSALAASCRLPFIATSYAQWQSAGDGHLGFVTRAIRSTFSTANERAPCLVFIDEIDTVRGRGTADRDGWWSAITTALLESLDGTARREGVVVIAACNDPRHLDPALVRSGRLDRRFEIGLPDEAALLRIFGHHLPGTDLDAFAPAATALAGSTSGADVARIAREARRVARREKRDVEASDLLDIAIPADTRPPAMRRLIAVHEAGHAVAMLATGRRPDSLSLVGVGGWCGAVLAAQDFGLCRRADIEAEILVLLAGRAAEEVVLGEPSGGASDDLRRATALMAQLLGTHGLGGRLVYDEKLDVGVVEAALREVYGRALRLVGEHRHAVEKLADLALDKRVLGRAALEAFAAEHLGGRP